MCFSASSLSCGSAPSSRTSRFEKEKRHLRFLIIICAYNEARHIRQKIANCLDFDYPRDQTEIIIVSDGSTDDTDKILASLQGALVKTYRMPQQRGKTECQNLAAEIANNQILFFTDATVMHPPNALKLLVRSLCDSSVGCVTGKPVFNRDMGPASMGLSEAREI